MGATIFDKSAPYEDKKNLATNCNVCEIFFFTTEITVKDCFWQPSNFKTTG